MFTIKSIRMIFFLTCLFSLALASKQTTYRQGENVSLYYNKLFSPKNPLTYSIDVLPFMCSTPTPRKKSFLVFDQDLRGDRPFQSDIQVSLFFFFFFFLTASNSSTCHTLYIKG
ncbi:hypothetical protein BY458DRAFT_516452, partial [Sporodiniella umbellata]